MPFKALERTKIMTIKDVAKHSGVAISTVSRVLNNHPDVSEKVRKKVLDTVHELHYVPNNSARDLVKPQSDCIGVIVRGIENPFFTSLLRSIEKATADAGYTMVLHQISTEEDELSAGAALVRSKRLRGLILMGGCFDYTAEQIENLEVPFVCCSFTNTFGSLDKAAYSSVCIDDHDEAYRAVKLLTEKGHKKIAVLLDSTSDRSISELRYRGYCDALRDAGIELDPDLVAETVDFGMQAAYDAVIKLINRNSDFTALFAIADSMGMAAMKALHNMGKRIPEDCSIISIDGIDFSLYTVPTLTTLIQPHETMGSEAVKILVDVIEGKRKSCQIKLDTTLRVGGTVAAHK